MNKKQLKRHRLTKPKHILRWEIRWDYSNTFLTGIRYPQRDWNQTLVTKINQISTQIHMSSDIRPSNTIEIGSLDVLVLFESLEYYHNIVVGNDQSIVGKLNKHVVLYKPELNENAIYIYDNENDSGGMGKITIDNLNI